MFSGAIASTQAGVCNPSRSLVSQMPPMPTKTHVADSKVVGATSSLSAS